MALTLNVPDFALINQHVAPHYLGSNNLPELLSILPPQDLVSHLFADSSDPSPRAGLEEPVWDALWQDAAHISITTVPEPSALALFAIATLLFGNRNLRQRK